MGDVWAQRRVLIAEAGDLSTRFARFKMTVRGKALALTKSRTLDLGFLRLCTSALKKPKEARSTLSLCLFG
jgi:hypothetical protein